MGCWGLLPIGGMPHLSPLPSPLQELPSRSCAPRPFGFDGKTPGEHRFQGHVPARAAPSGSLSASRITVSTDVRISTWWKRLAPMVAHAWIPVSDV